MSTSPRQGCPGRPQITYKTRTLAEIQPPAGGVS